MKPASSLSPGIGNPKAFRIVSDLKLKGEDREFLSNQGRYPSRPTASTARRCPAKGADPKVPLDVQAIGKDDVLAIRSEISKRKIMSGVARLSAGSGAHLHRALRHLNKRSKHDRRPAAILDYTNIEVSAKLIAEPVRANTPEMLFIAGHPSPRR
jgi:hypothetical protein